MYCEIHSVWGCRHPRCYSEVVEEVIITDGGALVEEVIVVDDGYGFKVVTEEVGPFF